MASIHNFSLFGDDLEMLSGGFHSHCYNDKGPITEIMLYGDLPLQQRKILVVHHYKKIQIPLPELDEKTAAMLKLIEEDADSFAKRAEMYYKKRPELINFVGDFYRSFRLLAERYDQAKFDSSGTTKLLTPWMTSSLFFSKSQTEKSNFSVEKSYDTYSENYDLEELVESEIENPGSEFGEVVDEEKEEFSNGVVNDEVLKLREEINRLKEENGIQKEQLLQKDEEKREAIRQLSVAVDLLKEENLQLRQKSTDISPNKQSPIEFNKLKGMFGKLFNGSSIPKASTIPLLDLTS